MWTMSEPLNDDCIWLDFDGIHHRLEKVHLSTDRSSMYGYPIIRMVYDKVCLNVWICDRDNHARYLNNFDNMEIYPVVLSGRYDNNNIIVTGNVKIDRSPFYQNFDKKEMIMGDYSDNSFSSIRLRFIPDVAGKLFNLKVIDR